MREVTRQQHYKRIFKNAGGTGPAACLYQVHYAFALFTRCFYLFYRKDEEDE